MPFVARLSQLEAYLGRKELAQPLLASIQGLLVGSALYLLLESHQDRAAHELNNLDRITTLLIKFEGCANISREQCERLLSAVEEAQGPSRGKGVQVDRGKLKQWEQRLKACLGTLPSPGG